MISFALCEMMLVGAPVLLGANMKLHELRYGRKVIFQGKEYEVCSNPPYKPHQIPLRNDDSTIWDAPYAHVDELQIVEEDSQDPLALEAEFQQVFEQVHPLIQANLAEAARLINEAVSLSEKSGVPFCPKEKLTWIKPSYIPKSFREKFPNVEKDFVEQVTDSYGWHDGWQYSQTC